MSSAQLVNSSNGVTWNEVNQVASRAETLRKTANSSSSSAKSAADANNELAQLEASNFSRIINDPSLNSVDKFKMLMKITGGTFSPAQNTLISNLFQEFSQTMTMLTNMVKIVHETMMSAVRNIRA